MKTYRVAILGCRSRGTAAARAYHAHPRTEVVGLCDLKSDLTEALGREVGNPPRFTDLDEMIRGTGPDLVAIPTGTEFHHDLCLRVLGHGVHIEVEKPICVDLGQADEVLAKARAKGVRVAVHHQGRVGPPMQAILRAIRSGRIGPVRYITASGKGYYGGYGLMNIGTHLLNNIIGLAGHCRGVTALALTAGRPIAPGDVVQSPSGMGTIAGERITATLHFDGGVTANLLQHRLPKVDNTAYGLEVLGHEGRLFWKSGGAWWLPTPHFVPETGEGPWQPLESPAPDSYDAGTKAQVDDYAFVDDYVKALDEGREHACSGAEATHVLEIMMGVFESAAYGRRVDLPQTRRDHPLLRWRAEAGLPPPPSAPRGYTEWLAAEDRRLGRT